MVASVKKAQSYGVIVVCPHDEQFLLVQRAAEDGNGFWSFPKGRPEQFEHKTTTALRELQEETGLKPDEFSDQLIFQDEFTFQDEACENVEKTVTYFVAIFYEPRTAEISDEFSSEIAQAKWCSYDDACKKLHQSTCDVLKEAKLELSLNGLL